MTPHFIILNFASSALVSRNITPPGNHFSLTSYHTIHSPTIIRIVLIVSTLSIPVKSL